MKKMYLKPETKSFRIETQPLLNMSLDENGGTGTLQNTGATGSALSRDYDDWDD